MDLFIFLAFDEMLKVFMQNLPVLKLFLHALSFVWLIAVEFFLPLYFQLVVVNILEGYYFFNLSHKCLPFLMLIFSPIFLNFP